MSVNLWGRGNDNLLPRVIYIPVKLCFYSNFPLAQTVSDAQT